MNAFKHRLAAQSRRLSKLYSAFHEYLITRGAKLIGNEYHITTIHGNGVVRVHMAPPLRPWVKCVLSDPSKKFVHHCMDWDHVYGGEYYDTLVREYDQLFGVEVEA